MKKILNIVNYFSLLWLVFLYGSVIFVLIITGNNPEFSRPDPSQIIPAFYLITELFHLNNIVFIMAVVLNTVFYIYFSKKRKVEISTFLFLGSLLLRIGVHLFDPGGYLEWFID